MTIPYNSFNQHLRERFGGRVHRVAVDAGFGCPNRDGIKGRGGCLYCDADGSRAFYVEPDSSVRQQLEARMETIRRRFHANKFIAYFQAFSNTYAPIEKLRAIYEEALFDPKQIIGLSIGTRPDCVTPEVLDLLAELNERTYLWLEYGLESVNQSTLDSLNRLDTVDQWRRAVRQTRERGIRVASHVIAGLPGDSPDDFLSAAKLLNEYEVNGVKIHNLYISRRAPIARLHEASPFPLLSREEYIDLLCEFLARLRKDILIHRLTGEATPDDHIGPEWVLHKAEFLLALKKEMKKRNITQGCRVG